MSLRKKDAGRTAGGRGSCRAFLEFAAKRLSRSLAFPNTFVEPEAAMSLLGAGKRICVGGGASRSSRGRLRLLLHRLLSLGPPQHRSQSRKATRWNQEFYDLCKEEAADISSGARLRLQGDAESEIGNGTVSSRITEVTHDLRQIGRP